MPSTRASRPHIHSARSSRQLDPETWPDFERLFAANGGVQGGCWCMFYHAAWMGPRYARNKRAKRALVEEGRAHGTIVYCGREPVGWCQFGSREELPRVDRMRGYEPTDPGAWRITCLFVDAEHRRSGVARMAVVDSIAAMRVLGAASVEAYPVVGRLGPSSLWNGTPALYEGLGFARAGPLGARRWVYSADLARLK